MATATQQARVLNKGRGEQVVRARERSATPLTLHHDLSSHRLSQLLQQMQAHMPMGVSLVAIPQTTLSALEQSEAQVERLLQERSELLQKMQQLEAQMTAAPMVAAPVILTPPVEIIAPAVPVAEKWVSLTRAAEILKVSYSTARRAVVDGHMVGKPVPGGGRIKTNWLCLASTYHKKGAVSA